MTVGTMRVSLLCSHVKTQVGCCFDTWIWSHLTDSVITCHQEKRLFKEIKRLTAVKLGRLCFIHMMMTSILFAAITHCFITMKSWWMRDNKRLVLSWPTSCSIHLYTAHFLRTWALWITVLNIVCSSLPLQGGNATSLSLPLGAEWPKMLK